MDWARHKSDWPNAQYSKFVSVRPHRWHVQQSGAGPELVLLHGAGASTHSWAPMFDQLSNRFRVTALDLPGQGFTSLGASNRAGLEPMAQDIASLLDALAIHPDVILGHSAGAAIALSLTKRLDPAPTILSINGAFANFGGIAGILFPAVAKLLSLNPITGQLFSHLSAREHRIKRLIGSTGSQISEAQIKHYTALVADADHVNATLAMMAQWSLDGVPQMLRDLSGQIHFLTGENDGAVPPKTSLRAANTAEKSSYKTIAGLGHLMHEESPETVLTWMDTVLDRPSI